MIQICHSLRDVEHELVYASHVRVLDVLWLVRRLVAIRLTAGGGENDRDTVPRIVRVIAAAIDVLRMPVRIHRVIELEGPRFGAVYPLGDVSKLGGQTTRSHRRQVVVRACQLVAGLVSADDVSWSTASDVAVKWT